MKISSLKLACVLLLCTTPFCWAQLSSAQNSSSDQNTTDQNTAPNPNTQSNQINNSDQAQSADSNPLSAIAESTKAIDYRQGSKSEIQFKGTDLMPEVTGTAHVQTKSGATQIDAKLEHLKPANSLGLQYLTYVLWGVSPEGVPSNLGELIVKDGKSEIHASTPMQAFALIVTAEPYFAVTQPNEKVVAQNEPGANAQGFVRPLDIHYQALPASAYSTQPIQEPVYGIDKKVPLSLTEARNAVRIAKDANADQYANAPLQRAEQLLSQADDYYNRKQNDKAIATVAREATQAAEAARVMAIKGEQQAKIDRRQREADQRAAKAEADAQAQAQQAQDAQAKAQALMQQAQQAESARQNAEQQAAQAAQAAQQAAQAAQAAQQQLAQQASAGQQVQAEQQAAAQQAQQQAQQAQQQAAAAQQHAQEEERAAQLAEQQLQQQQAAAAAAQQQLQQEQAARQQAEQQAQASQQQLQQTQQQLSQAQTDKEQMRQRLLDQLNQVLQTKDSARGLIVNMPDVLFNLNSASLKTDARERLAKVAGILIAYPDIHVEVDGYTDNTGTLDYNQQLSQQRADTVRSYLVQQGVPSSSIESKGFGPNDPVASNDTPQGRQQNRRVDLIVSGQSIGAHLMQPNGNQ
jgi:outer membrane protein OmpA-like peptidoglycan-associated protein